MQCAHIPTDAHACYLRSCLGRSAEPWRICTGIRASHARPDSTSIIAWCNVPCNDINTLFQCNWTGSACQSKVARITQRPDLCVGEAVLAASVIEGFLASRKLLFRTQRRPKGGHLSSSARQHVSAPIYAKRTLSSMEGFQPSGDACSRLVDRRNAEATVASSASSRPKTHGRC
jgi:hypothetical protein